MINEGMLVWVPPWIEQSGTLLLNFLKSFFGGKLKGKGGTGKWLVWVKPGLENVELYQFLKPLGGKL